MSVPPFHSASLDELTRWAKRLKYFRLVASDGYNKESSDTLTVHLRYSNPVEYLKILTTLGISPSPLSPGAVLSSTKSSFTSKEMTKLEHDINDIPGYQQSSLCAIGESYLFIWANSGIVRMIYSDKIGPLEWISDEDVAAAAMIESVLETLVPFIIDPPVDSPRCFCPKYYPYAFI